MHSNIWKIVLSVVKRNKIKSMLTVLMILGSIAVALIPPLTLEKMVNTLSDGKAILLTVALMYLLIFAASGIMESIQNIMITVMGQAITHEMRSVMSQKLPYLPTAYFISHETGRITSRFVNDVDAVDSLFTNGIISMFADAFKIISIMIVIFVKSKGLGMILCVVTPLLFWMTYVFQKKMRHAQIKNREAVARVNHHVPETIQNIRMIHTFSCEKYMEEKYDSYIEAGYRAMNQSNFYDAIYSPIIICISSLLIAVMMVCAAMGAGVQQLFGISVGSAVAMIAYVGKVFDPLESLGIEIQNIQTALAGVVRINDFLQEEELNIKYMQLSKMQDNAQNSEDSWLTEKEKLKKNDRKGFICFDHVTFDYGDGKNIFTDESFTIAEGEHVMFTGRTGAGKSTLFKLLLGLYAPVSGTVTIEGIAAEEIADTDRRKIFGYVEQHFSCVEGTLRDQITLFDEAISDEDVWNALGQCGLKNKVSGLPKQLNQKMKAIDFSQGELQLLSIARALTGKPRIMLLDEMTANLDSMTEKRILDTIHVVSKGRTVLSISHRMTEQLEHTRVITIGAES